MSEGKWTAERRAKKKMRRELQASWKEDFYDDDNNERSKSGKKNSK